MKMKLEDKTLTAGKLREALSDIEDAQSLSISIDTYNVYITVEDLSPFQIVYAYMAENCSFCGRNMVYDHGVDILVTSNSIDKEEMQEIAEELIELLPNTWTIGGVTRTAILLSNTEKPDGKSDII
ncbi:MAG: hypothetical protein CL489_06245 [Acidobacteria bacterium]|nr:hypothetical protein [Acidobacteriota bacterium]|tara:strand:- start:37131 stop:37508 length:378 start_codon:yes stop_codon:yes gene_type:complete